MVRNGVVMAAARLALAASILIAGGRHPAAAAQSPDSTFDRGVLDVRVGATLSASMPAFLNARGAALLPVERVLSLAGLLPAAGSTDSLRLVPMLGSDVPAALDLRQRIVQRRDIKSPIGRDELLLAGGEWYLATDRLAELLGTHVSLDLGNLTVVISRQPPFPAEQQRASDDPNARYDAGRFASAEGYDVPFLRRTGGLVADWMLSASGSGVHRTATLHSEFGFALAGGAVTASTGVSSHGLDRSALGSSWQYQWVSTSQPWLRAIQLGNFGAGTTGRAMQGVSVTNVRPYRNGLFSVVGVVPEAPPGWSYEVYRGNRLLGFSNGTQRTPVQVPMDYGSTPIELRFLGPAGEEIRTTYTYQIPAQQVPPGRLEYSLGAGRCAGAADCRIGYGNLATGLRSWLTLSGGGELLDSTTRVFDPVARALVSFPAGWTGHADWTKPTSSVGFSYFGPARVNGGLDAGLLGNESTIASFANAGGRRYFIEPTLTMGLLSTHGIATHTLHLSGRVERGVHSSLADRTRVSTALDLSRGRLSAEYGKDLANAPGQVTLGGFIITPRTLPTRLRSLPITGSLGLQRTGIHLATLGGALLSDERRSLNLDVRWSRPTAGTSASGPAVSLSYSATLSAVRQSLSVNTTSEGAATADAFVSGLAVYDPRVGFRSLPRSGINTSGVAGRVFYDNDGDGKFGPGDQPADDIAVHAEGLSATTDAQGRYTMWGLTAFEPTHVGVDTVQVADAGFVPSESERTLRLSPNVYTRIDLALSRTRELTGRVEADSTVPAAGGVTVELHNKLNGRSYSAVTFADGGYYFGRVLPGMYDVVVAPSSLASLRAAARDPVLVQVKANGQDAIEVAALRLTAAARKSP